ncbi:hypothetical protein [Actinoplanes sp. RD1]|uniref:hypothetical protein n=1 Tax=Actinoplanes sp. RD1 TaxID=3064538 RepID=UPI002741F919|nr:hypothetical protein [Actinoplanes sp. RD1]
MTYQRVAWATVTSLLLAACGSEPAGNDGRVLHDAEQVLVQRCMQRAGFDYWPEPAQQAQERSFPYVLDDVDWARRHGYSSFRQPVGGESSANQRYHASLPTGRRAAAIVALNGREPTGLRARLPNGLLVEHSDEGCVSEARSGLYGDLATWYRVTKVAESLPGVRAGLVTADARFTAAVRRWAACMHRGGHPYDSPAALHAAFADAEQRLPRPDETELAVAEARCAGTSGLSAVSRELDSRYQDVLSEQTRSDLEARRRLQSRALPRAREIVRSR